MTSMEVSKKKSDDEFFDFVSYLIKENMRLYLHDMYDSDSDDVESIHLEHKNALHGMYLDLVDRMDSIYEVKVGL